MPSLSIGTELSPPGIWFFCFRSQSKFCISSHSCTANITHQYPLFLLCSWSLRFQRGQKDHVENTYTCIYGIYGCLLQAVNTILQHWNFPNHQSNIIAAFQGFLHFPTSPPSMQHVASFFLFSHHLMYLCIYIQLLLLENYFTHSSMFSCHI